MRSRLVLVLIVSATAAAATATSMIVAISPPLASGEEAACAAAPEVYPGFQATRPAVPAPDIAFIEDGTVERRLAEFRGRGVVLNFWATWCAPCVREMPALDRLQAQSGDAFAVLALSGDRGGAPVVAAFYDKVRIANLANLVDPGRKALRAMSIRGLPTTVLIDARGDEIGRVLGAAEWDAPEAIEFVRACLGAPLRQARRGRP